MIVKVYDLSKVFGENRRVVGEPRIYRDGVRSLYSLAKILRKEGYTNFSEWSFFEKPGNHWILQHYTQFLHTQRNLEYPHRRTQTLDASLELSTRFPVPLKPFEFLSPRAPTTLLCTRAFWGPPD